MKKEEYLSTIGLDRHPDKPGEIAEVQIISPMADGLATKVGHILVSWGQMMDTTLRYMKCLIDHNKTDQFLLRAPNFKQLSTCFEEEAERALSSTTTAKWLPKDFLKRVKRARPVRNHLAHDRNWGQYKGQPSVLVNVKTKAYSWRTLHLNLARLEETHLNIAIAHGRLFQLALSNQVPPPYTSAEISLLQEIVAKGYLNLPTPGMPQGRRQPSSPK